MSFEKLVINNLKKYKVLAIIGVFVSFFVVVGILNYFQRVTLEGFVNLQQAQAVVEKFGGCNGNARRNTVSNFRNKEGFKNKENFRRRR